MRSLLSRANPLASADVQRQRLRAVPLAREFDGAAPLRASRIEVLQVNVGKLCNQTCRHCHVDAGPDRREQMSRETMEDCLRAVERARIAAVDITGGAPELHPDFRWFVAELAARGVHVMDRCNLTILEVPAHADLPELFARHRVEVIASLPHYRAMNTDRQRGEGVFERSIAGIRRLNRVGYGGGELRLALVTNPVGAYLPGAQASLELEWKREMKRLYDVSFDALYCLTNMPISRFLDWLIESGNLEAYMERLVAAFNPAAVAGLMCRSTISVGWDGALYDCDFNQMLEMPVAAPARHVRDLDRPALEGRAIATDRHCFGCTAGAGSSCGGQTSTS